PHTILSFLYFSLYSSHPPRDLHSFPTRRSSDLETHASIRSGFRRRASAHCGGTGAGTSGNDSAADPSPRCHAGERDSNGRRGARSEEHTSELQSRFDLVCRLLLEKKKKKESIIL